MAAVNRTMAGPTLPPKRGIRWTVRVPRILLVEDNEMNRDMLMRRLQRKGFQVLTAVDGSAGSARSVASTW